MTKFSLLSYFLSLLGGFLYSLGFPSFLLKEKILFFGPIIGVGFLLTQFPLLGKKVSFRHSVTNLLLFSLAHNLTGFYWIAETLEVFGEISAPFNYLLGLTFSLLIVPQFWVFLFLVFSKERLGLGPGAGLMKIASKWPTSFSLILWSLTLTLCEYFVPQLFPGHVGHSWLALAPYLNLAPIFGVPLYSFIGFWMALLSIHWIRTKKINFTSLGLIGVLLIGNFYRPLTRLSPGLPPKLPSEQGENQISKINLRIVQANIGSLMKVASENGTQNSVAYVQKLYKNLSIQPSSEPLDLIIWPETAFPHPLDSYRWSRNKNLLPPTLMQNVLAYHPKAHLLFGGYDQDQRKSIDDEYESLYNAAFLLTPQGHLRAVYHKHLLIPFGETLPFGPANQLLSRYIDNISYFSRGEDFTLFQMETGHHFATAICYELLFSNFIRDILNNVAHQPDFLINLTNDSWYGKTAEPFQHLFLAKWRAVEFNIPIVRATNTGISSIIYPDGSESARLQIEEMKNLDLTLFLHQNHEKTFFQKWGIWSLFFLGLLLLITTFAIHKIIQFKNSTE